MTEKKSTELTILFADICRSTVLFEKLGDQAALDLVMETLQLAGGIAINNHGTVIGTIGDEVLCTFKQAKDALMTANQLHSEMQKNALTQKHQLALRVGINSGPVVSVKDNVYGDTVNIAARLAQQAKAHQSLVSSDTIASVNENIRSQVRFVGKISLQGKAGLIEVHELLQTDAEEAITEVATTDAIPARSFLMTARYQSRRMRFDPMLVRFLFGRGVDCDQVINHPTISREHAEFLYRNGQFILRDFSTNGSVVVQNNKTRQLHRTSMELRGTGKIYFGKTINQLQFCIEFTCTGGR